MYELYCKKMEKDQLPAVKVSFYRRFFAKKRKDRCELHKLETEYVLHSCQKQATRIERKGDRQAKINLSFLLIW